MVEMMVPIFRVADAAKTAKWYARLGFEVAGEHRFAPGLPLFVFLERNGVRLYLSEHTGDARRTHSSTSGWTRSTKSPRSSASMSWNNHGLARSS